MPSVNSVSNSRPRGLLDGDDTILADFLHDIGDQLANLWVSGGNRGDLRDVFLALDFLGKLANVLHNLVTSQARCPA